MSCYLDYCIITEACIYLNVGFKLTMLDAY